MPKDNYIQERGFYQALRRHYGTQIASTLFFTGKNAHESETEDQSRIWALARYIHWHAYVWDIVPMNTLPGSLRPQKTWVTLSDSEKEILWRMYLEFLRKILHVAKSSGYIPDISNYNLRFRKKDFWKWELYYIDSFDLYDYHPAFTVENNAQLREIQELTKILESLYGK